MRPIAYAFTALLLMTASSSAQSFIGAGGISCSETMSLPKSSSTRYMVDSFAQGYVSGIAAVIYTTDKIDMLAPVSAKEVLDFVDFYCRDNPKKTLLNATNAYVMYLGRKSRR